jgi:leader peptidase (prepilin peptidase) / N-methyltransferase
VLNVAVVVVAVLLGLIVGSFLNVVIVREPKGESVVRPRSACPACSTPIAARDNVPVLSYLLLRGRARCCGAPISARYPVVELLTGVAFGVVAAWTGLSWELPALLYLVAISIPLAAIDLATHRLPDKITLPSYVVATVLLVVAAIGEGEPERLVGVAACGAGLWLFYFALILAYPAGMGFGDVKLAGVLGLYLGWFGWQYALIGTFLAFLVGAVVGVALMASGRATRKTAIPFGPYMLIGAFLALAAGSTIADWYLSAFSSS